MDPGVDLLGYLPGCYDTAFVDAYCQRGALQLYGS